MINGKLLNNLYVLCYFILKQYAIKKTLFNSKKKKKMKKKEKMYLNTIVCFHYIC